MTYLLIRAKNFEYFKISIDGWNKTEFERQLYALHLLIFIAVNTFLKEQAINYSILIWNTIAENHWIKKNATYLLDAKKWKKLK